MTAYRAFDKLIQLLPVEEHGVRMRMSNFFFSQPLETMPGQLEKMKEIESTTDVCHPILSTFQAYTYFYLSQIQAYKRDPNLITMHAVNQNAGVVDSYQHLAPIIDTDHYMFWLRDIVNAKGARLITKRINGDLLSQEERLLAQYGADAIINATALGAAELASDPKVYPLRGALIRVVNDGSCFPQVKEALCVSHDDTQGDDTEDIVFIVPRNDRTLILGGEYKKHYISVSI